MGTVGENPGDRGEEEDKEKVEKEDAGTERSPPWVSWQNAAACGQVARADWHPGPGAAQEEIPGPPARRDRAPPAGVKRGRKRQPRPPQRVPWRRAPRKGARTGTHRCPSWLTPPGRALAGRCPGAILPDRVAPGDRLDNGYPNIIPWGPVLRGPPHALVQAGRDAPYREAGDPERGAGGGRAGGCLGRGGNDLRPLS